MIKRRHYRIEHGSRDAASESSSSDDDSEIEAKSTDESEEEDEVEEEEENAVTDVREGEGASSSSGYESEDSSVNEVNLDSSGLPTSDDELAAEHDGQIVVGKSSSGKRDALLSKMQHSSQKDAVKFDEADYVLKRKSVFKCRLCPRIVCLSEETLKAHLISKRHARSEKLLKEGRLKLMLNDDGQIEGETQPAKNAMATDSEEELSKPKKKGKGLRARMKRRELREQKELMEQKELREQKESGYKMARRPTQNREKRRKKDS